MRHALPISLSALALAPVAGCGYLELATSDRPSGTQMEAVGDAFASIGAFVQVMRDPATADDGDLADLHATRPYEIIVDPATAPPAGKPAARRGALDPACVTVGDDVAAWDCDFTLDGAPCHALGSGRDHGDGTYSGTSTQTCAGATVTVTAERLAFDEEAGVGDGVVRIEADARGWALVTIDGLGFCTDEASPAPDRGTFTVDGLGDLDGRPFDPLTIEFTDTPACGTALIAD